MPSHLLSEVLSALNQKTGSPSIRRPPSELQYECDLEGLSAADFSELTAAIVESRHAPLAARSIRLLIPRKRLSSDEISPIVTGFSKTDSVLVRMNWSRYLCALWDSDGLGPDGKNCLRSGYAVFFHFIHSEKSQKDICRLLYRMTRKVDVTPFRCKTLSIILEKSGSVASPAMALAELFDAFKPKSIIFPPKEHGVPGSSGFSKMSKVKLHAKMLRDVDPILLNALLTHCLDVDGEDVVGDSFASEKIHPTKRPKLLSSDPSSTWDSNTDAISSASSYISDMLRISRTQFLEDDPKSPIDRDLQLAFFAHLSTWDGYLHQDETLQALSRTPYPLRSEQSTFEKSVILPLLETFSTGPVEFKLKLSRSIAQMLAAWISLEENCGSYVQRIVSLMDDAFFAALVFENDDPLSQLAVVDFFSITGLALYNRSKVFVSAASPAVPPSEHLALRLLLSPSVVGVSAMSYVLEELLPVFRLESTSGVHTANAVKLQTARNYQNLLQDYVKVLVLASGLDPFEEIVRMGSGSEQHSFIENLNIKGDELGITKSFAFASLWKRWWEEEREEPIPSDEKLTNFVMVAFLNWLKKLVPGVTELVKAMSTTFNKLL